MTARNPLDHHDAGGVGEYTPTALPCPLALQDLVLFQIRANAGILDSIVTTIPEILGFTRPSLIYTLVQQHLLFYVNHQGSVD